MILALQLLCFTTITLCAVLLLRAWTRTRLRLLLFSSIGFIGMSIDNVFVVVEAATGNDFSAWRSLPTLVGMAVMIWGLGGDRDR